MVPFGVVLHSIGVNIILSSFFGVLGGSTGLLLAFLGDIVGGETLSHELSFESIFSFKSQ